MKKIAFLFLVLLYRGSLLAQPMVQFDIISSDVSEGSATLVISASIQNPDLNATSVDVNILPGATATFGTDYNYAPVTITFPGGSTAAQNIVVSLYDDAIVEGNETFALQLAFPTNGATIGSNSQHTVTILDNDLSTVTFDGPYYRMPESNLLIYIQVSLSVANQDTVRTTVHLDLANTTLTQGSDIIFNDTTLTWLPGVTGTLYLPLTLLDDNLPEPDETAIFQLINPSPNVQVAIDTFLFVLYDDATVALGGSYFKTPESTNFVTMAVILIGESQNSVYTTVHLDLPNSSATQNIDFLLSDTVLTWPSGTNGTLYLTVPFVNDNLQEGDETARFQLINTSTNASVGLDTFLLVIAANDTLIVNDDLPGALVSENAGSVNVPITLTNIRPSVTQTTLHLLLNGTTATNGSDFVFNDTTIVWSASTSGTRNIPIAIINDLLYEPNETIRLQVTNTTNGVIVGNDTSLIVIHSDELLPSGNCSDLYFSEYIHGTANNTAVEIYNPTLMPIDLQDYRLIKSQNGTTLSVFRMKGLLAPKSVFVAANPLSSSIILTHTDTVSSFFDFTGNDALLLLHQTDTIDAIGRSYQDPGPSGWAVGAGSTTNHTLIRSAYRYHGNAIWDSSVVWWTSYPANMFDSLGEHHSAPCGAYLPFPQLASVRFVASSDTVVEDTFFLKVVVQVINYSGYPFIYAVARDDNSSTATYGHEADFYFDNNVIPVDTGITYDTVSVQILNDNLVEPIEKILLRLINIPINAKLTADSIFTIYIKDEDSLTSTFYGAGFSYIEKDTDVLVRVLLSPRYADSLFCADTVARVKVTLAAGSATPCVDFLFKDTILTFKTYVIDTQGVRVHIFGDNLLEGNEEINFNMTNLTPHVLSGIIGYTLRIIDNDYPLAFAEEEFNKQMRLFPNPVSQILFIEAETEKVDVHITDMLGIEVLKVSKLELGRNTVDVSTLAKGMYFVCINDTGILMSKRFVKAE